MGIGFFVWAVIGCITAVLVKSVLPGVPPGGLGRQMIVGIVGAWIGAIVSFAASGLQNPFWGGYSGTSLLAFIGALVLLLLHAFIFRRSAV